MRSIAVFSLIVVVTLMTGCAQQEASKRWQAVEVAGLDTGLATPECMVALPGSEGIAVSNINTDNEGYWVDDGNGYISLMDTSGRAKSPQWVVSTPDFPIHAPKGMAVCQGKLYFTDNQKLKRCDVETGGNLETIAGFTGEQLNDLATDGRAVWVTDTKAGKIYRVATDGTYREVKSPAGVNGVTCWKGKVFAVSWTLQDVYEIDPTGKKAPQPFGLTEYFTNTDGIEVLDDGTFIVSDFNGHRIVTIAPDRKTVHTLIELDTPADIGLDREKGLLLVPQFKEHKAMVYRLTKL